MVAQEKMTVDERRKYLRIQKERYTNASRAERSSLLSEMAAVTGLNRKYLIYLLQGDLQRQSRQRQRGRSYSPEVEAAVLLVAESLDFPCGKRLKPVLVETAEILAQHQELSLTPALRTALEKISVSTLDRLLQRYAVRQQKRLVRRRPQRRSQAAERIPMRRIPWNQREPGHMEVDLVHHCGQATTGDYVHTLQMVDVATGWSERYAILGRSGLVMHDAFEVLLTRFPFPLRQIHSDNGSEFLNDHLYRFWQQRDPYLLLTRNRLSRKNDNPFVEEKNFTAVRAYLGYGRFDTVEQTWGINDLYESLSLYQNLFLPVMRLDEKEWITTDGQPTRLKRHHDQPMTPFARLCQTAAPSEEERQRLGQLRRSLNPRRLRQQIYQQIKDILALPCAAPGQVQDVFLTLSKYRPAYTRKEEEAHG